MEYNLRSKNGYTIENISIEGDTILIECQPKEATHRLFSPLMLQAISTEFKENTGLTPNFEDMLLLNDLLGVWVDSFSERFKENKEA
jgi:hypothetical protein